MLTAALRSRQTGGQILLWVVAEEAHDVIGGELLSPEAARLSA